jgi:hypothetical protein
MFAALKVLLKQPYWVIALILGAGLVVFPCVTIDKDNHWNPHQPSTLWPVVVGLLLLLLSSVGFVLTFLQKRATGTDDIGAGLDLSCVKEGDGALWTTVNGCEIRVVDGRIEDYAHKSGIAVALPCNEYFDDLCVVDSRSALGAFVARAFDGQAPAFVALSQDQCRKKLGAGAECQKTEETRALSFGVGRCVLLIKPLGRSVPVGLVSTTTQRASQGLTGRISYLFDGMRELVSCLADARLNEVVMPILGAGHGGIHPPLALVGLLLALAEAARYGQGGQRLKRATIVVFKQNAETPGEVDQVVVRRALALIGSRG